VECDYRRGLDWRSGLVDSLVQCVSTFLQVTITHTLVSTITSSVAVAR
jgi:hypothetical protein